MEYNILGNSKISVSELCLGTMTWGGLQNNQEDGHAQMDYALERGINFFDTAEVYPVPMNSARHGNTERCIGNWFTKSGQRDQVILATKIAGSSEIAWLRPNSQQQGRATVNKASIIVALEASLGKLRTDYIDIYQIHWPSRTTNCFGRLGYTDEPDDDEDRFSEIITTMEELRKAGKIRAYGISNETPYGLMEYLRHSERLNLPAPASIQNPYSLLNRVFEIGLAEICLRCNIAGFPYSPMGFGMLSGKYHNGTDEKTDRLNMFPEFVRYNNQLSRTATQKYIDVAKKNGLDMSQMALAFVRQQSFNTSMIIGATNLEQLKSNIDSADLTLSHNVMSAIEKIHIENSNPAP